MKKFKYLKLSKTKKLRFIENYFKKNFMLFFYMVLCLILKAKNHKHFSDTQKNKIGFVALEYSGHGKSSGEFTKGNISSWTNDTKALIKKLLKTIILFLLAQAWVHG